jgi:hypothetical protein
MITTQKQNAIKHLTANQHSASQVVFHQRGKNFEGIILGGNLL